MVSSASDPTAAGAAGSTVALVVVDACMTFPDLKSAALAVVSDRLAARAAVAAAAVAAAAAIEGTRGTHGIGNEAAATAEAEAAAAFVSPYTEDNVLICATHTHAAPGGYAPHALYNLTLGRVGRGSSCKP